MDWIAKFLREVPDDFTLELTDPDPDDRILGEATPALKAAFSAGAWHGLELDRLLQEHRQLHQDPSYDGSRCDQVHQDLQRRRMLLETFRDATVLEVFNTFGVSNDYGGVGITTAGIAMSPPEPEGIVVMVGGPSAGGDDGGIPQVGGD
ncbi:MAG TPA: hypothetical protein VD862_02370 [Candidatus Paceibacterota bacterium]|nr:hypothetical protein [Candidatus Paceibacterota bacterium]